MDILSCNWDSAKFLIFSLENVFDPVIYYSHLISLVGALFLGFIIILNKRTLINKIFFILTLCFTTWVYFDLILWASEKSPLIMFFWSAMIYVEYLMFVAAFWLMYLFLTKKNVPHVINILFILLFIPILVFGNSIYNLIAFDLSNCDRGAFEGALWVYLYMVELGIFFMAVFVSIKSFLQNKDNADRSKDTFFSMGTLAFMGIFFAGNITLLTDLGWNYEQYKLFGMVFFLLIILFLIVKFKTFNIKIIGAQALVWVMIILIGSQFLFIKSSINMILNAVTFITVSVSGLILVRSVKKVDDQRELLDVANKNQQSLLHFITHQVKGYLTKSRNIFDGIVVKDYGEIPDKVLEMAKYGFESDTRGVETVLAILRASDLKSGKITFKKEKTNISAVVAEVVEFRKEMAEKKNLDLTFEIESAIEIQVDPIQIKEVFKNLITNSILYTVKGTVHVVLKRHNGKIKFSVVDTGIGLNSQDKTRLFTEGGKGEDSLAVNVDSTGYGLYIASKIVQQHGGKIGARSKGRDTGSEFFVILPDIQ